jgi:hypothetical protein
LRHVERVRWRDNRTGTLETNDAAHVLVMTGAVPDSIENASALEPNLPWSRGLPTDPAPQTTATNEINRIPSETRG